MHSQIDKGNQPQSRPQSQIQLHHPTPAGQYHGDNLPYSIDPNSIPHPNPNPNPTSGPQYPYTYDANAYPAPNQYPSFGQQHVQFTSPFPSLGTASASINENSPLTASTSSGLSRQSFGAGASHSHMTAQAVYPHQDGPMSTYAGGANSGAGAGTRNSLEGTPQTGNGLRKRLASDSSTSAAPGTTQNSAQVTPPRRRQSRMSRGEADMVSRRESATSRTEEDASEPSRPTTADKSKNGDNAKLKLEAMDEDVEEEEEEKMDHRKRKRNRTIRSCVPCHNHKRKCDRRRPCGRCTALGLTGTCVYEVGEQHDMNDPNVAESERLRRRVAELEQVVRELRQRNPTRAQPASTSDEADDQKGRRVIIDRLARLKMDEAAMAELAAAAAVGKNSAGPSDEGEAKSKENQDYKKPYNTHLLPGEEMVHDRIGRKTFLGAPAGKSMLRRIRELTCSKPGELPVDSDEEILSVPDDKAFSIVFPDLRKTFPFTTIWSHDNFSSEIMGLLPNVEQAELLLQSWKEDVVPIILAYHVPTLEAEYRRFFAMSTAEKSSVPMSRLALYLMICASGCVMRAARAEIFGIDGQASVANASDARDITCSRLQSELYLSGAYQALRLCSFLANPTIYTIQAQVLINVYLYASERAADVWTLLGSLVRQAIAVGLHVDPVSMDPGVSMRDAEVRRRVWWSIAGLDALTCVLFGRPSCIKYYTTNLPQDRTDDNLSEAPGSAKLQLPPSNVLRNDTTDMTFHAAYFQLTIPSHEMLDRVFPMKRTYSRSALYGWFSPQPNAPPSDDSANTYEDAIRLARDIQSWYASLPRGIRYDPAEDTPERLSSTRSTLVLNQTIMLCLKTYILIMILHRPYLRLDPAAYPESKELCLNAAVTILCAYETAYKTKASVFWMWWSIPYRAFHAGAVCAFMAVREPDTELATLCHAHLRKAIVVFEDRLATWKIAHPVQADLVAGLIKLEQLATAAAARSQRCKAAKTAGSSTVPRNTDTASVSRKVSAVAKTNGMASGRPAENASQSQQAPVPEQQTRSQPHSDSRGHVRNSSGEISLQAGAGSAFIPQPQPYDNDRDFVNPHTNGGNDNGDQVVYHPRPSQGQSAGLPQINLSSHPDTRLSTNLISRPSTPLSEIRGFPTTLSTNMLSPSVMTHFGYAPPPHPHISFHHQHPSQQHPHGGLEGLHPPVTGDGLGPASNMFHAPNPAGKAVGGNHMDAGSSGGWASIYGEGFASGLNGASAGPADPNGAGGANGDSGLASNPNPNTQTSWHQHHHSFPVAGQGNYDPNTNHAARSGQGTIYTQGLLGGLAPPSGSAGSNSFFSSQVQIPPYPNQAEGATEFQTALNNETLGLPQFWADMFDIKLDEGNEGMTT